ncbi:MAG: SAM-dependent methyltransferase [Clostridia bacterium]|nr:SAM-dependent methyltransferase [Clostridia bacterium]
MRREKRIETVCAHLKRAKIFADVGCDHGYCSEYALKNGLCEFAIFSDISAQSLKKAETLLMPYVKAGRARGVVGDGFAGIGRETDEVLIAGMGGFEIVKILSDETHGFLPETFVFQPMHDSERLRRYLLENGGYIERDFTFRDGKFYDLIVGHRRKEGETPQSYSAAELEFGRDNIRERPQAFLEWLQKKLLDIERYIVEAGTSLKEKSRTAFEERAEKLKGVLSGEIK